MSVLVHGSGDICTLEPQCPHLHVEETAPLFCAPPGGLSSRAETYAHLGRGRLLAPITWKESKPPVFYLFINLLNFIHTHTYILLILTQELFPPLVS